MRTVGLMCVQQGQCWASMRTMCGCRPTKVAPRVYNVEWPTSPSMSAACSVSELRARPPPPSLVVLTSKTLSIDFLVLFFRVIEY